MFLENKYTRWYFDIIKKAQSRTLEKPYDRHHIIPKSLGGDNHPSNIVKLTHREHFVCHRLLIHMVENSLRYKMAFAAWQQSRSFKFKGKVTSRTFAILRSDLSKYYTGQKRKPFSEQAKSNMRAGAAGRKKPKMTEEWLESIHRGVKKREKLIGEKNPFYGKTHSNEFKLKKAEHNRNRPKVHCTHCDKFFDVGMANRWHLDNCKFKPQ